MSERHKMDPEASEFSDDLNKDIKRLKGHAQRYSRWAYVWYAVAFAFSALTTGLTAANWGPPPLRAVLAAIPGLAVLANTLFRFEEKARWCWEKVTYYDALLKRLKFEAYGAGEASKDKAKFDAEMQGKYPKPGALPASYSK